MPTQEDLDDVRSSAAQVVEAFASLGLEASTKPNAFAAAIWKVSGEDWDRLDEMVLAMHKKGDGLGPPENEDWPPLDGFPEATEMIREAAGDPSLRDDCEEVVSGIQEVLEWLSGEDTLTEHLARYTPTPKELAGPALDPAEMATRRRELARELEALETEDAHVEEVEETARQHDLSQVDATLSKVHAEHEHLETSLHAAERLPSGPKHDTAVAFIEPKLHELDEKEHELEEKRHTLDHPDTELIAHRHEEIAAKESVIRHKLEELDEESSSATDNS